MHPTVRELDRTRFQTDFPADRPFDVVMLGLNAVDSICILPAYPEHGGKMRIEERFVLGGGQIATAAALCGRYGLKTRYVGRVGDDDVGKFSLEDLGREPMDLAFVDVVEGAYSQFAVILVDRPTGERTVLWDRDSRLLYKPGELKKEAIVAGKLLHLDGHDVQASIQAASWAREAGMRVSLDIDKTHPGVEELLGLVDFAIPNLDFVREFSSDGDWRRGVFALGKLVSGHVMVTRGNKGISLLWENQIVSVPAAKINALDTTGAGDVSHGAFVYALFQGYSVLHCLRFANAAAVLSCLKYGARNSIPTLDEVMKKFAESPMEVDVSPAPGLKIYGGGRQIENA